MLIGMYCIDTGLGLAKDRLGGRVAQAWLGFSKGLAGPRIWPSSLNQAWNFKEATEVIGSVALGLGLGPPLQMFP